MAKKATLHDRLITALKAEGWSLHPNQPSSYTKLMNPEKAYYLFVGSAGALRRGSSVTASRSLTGFGWYNALLARTEIDGSVSVENL